MSPSAIRRLVRLLAEQGIHTAQDFQLRHPGRLIRDVM